MTPYLDRDGVTLYHGDCRDILPTLPRDCVIVSDPPFGISHRRGIYKQCADPSYRRISDATIAGDDEPFDPTPLLAFRSATLIGANHFADRLPPSRGWLVWDKLDGMKETIDHPRNGAKIELIWSSAKVTSQILRHRWRGVNRDSERCIPHYHPTQKPIGLMRQLIELVSTPDDVIVDPYAGSGSTLLAARDAGRRAIGIEIFEPYCEVIMMRLAQVALPSLIEQLA